MSITLRNTSDTATSQTYDYESKTTPLTSTEVDKNFITLKQKCDELATDYTTTFNADGSLKDGAVTSVSITDSSVTTTKIKDRSVDWNEQRNIIYLTDTSPTKNKVEGTLNNYQSDSGLSALPAGTVIYFKPANENTAGVTLIVKDLNTTTDDTSTLLSMAITKQKDIALSSDDLKAGGVYAAFYDGTTLQLVNTLQDPTVEIKESISRVQTFGPIEWEVASLPKTGDMYDAKDSGLTEHPTTVVAMLKCETADGDYTAGDLVPLELATDDSGDHGFTVRALATEIKVARSRGSSDAAATAGTALKLPKPSTGGVQTLNPANWTVVVRGTFQNDSTYSPAYVDRALSYPAAYACGGVTFGDYLYIFSSQNHKDKNKNPLYKINLVTNRAIYIGSTYGYQNPALMQHSATNELHATSVSVSEPGSGYKVGDIITLAGSSGEPAAGSYASVAKFTVKSITGGAATGPVGTLYDVTDGLGLGQSSGTYSVTPDSPVATTATAAKAGSSYPASAGANLTVVVNWSSIATPRIYWSAAYASLNYIEPNNSNNPETINPVKAYGNFNGTAHRAFNIQGEIAGEYYGFRTADHPNYLNAVHLYNSEGGYVNSSALNLFSNETVKGLEGQINKRLVCMQWNPVKGRLYAACQYTNLMHVFSWDAAGADLKTIFGNLANSAPSYVKTIGIPATGQTSPDWIDTIHVDWDTDTGEEKSITISRYAANGTITRAAWKED